MLISSGGEVAYETFHERNMDWVNQENGIGCDFIYWDPTTSKSKKHQDPS